MPPPAAVLDRELLLEVDDLGAKTVNLGLATRRGASRSSTPGVSQGGLRHRDRVENT